MSIENRKSTRHDVSLPATVEVNGESSESVAHNLSLGGGHFSYPTRLDMGTRVKVSFTVPTMEEAITVDGTVRWTAPAGIGVQFDGLRAREVWSLNKYFETLSG